MSVFDIYCSLSYLLVYLTVDLSFDLVNIFRVQLCY